jgi:hypothetical protein
MVSLHPITDRPELYFDRMGNIDYDAIREHMRAQARRVLDGYGVNEAWRQMDKDRLIEDVTSMVFHAFQHHHQAAMDHAFLAALADAKQAAGQAPPR